MSGPNLLHAIELAFIGYLSIGLFFSVTFLANSIHSVDSASREARLAFRLIILPGVVGLWPVLFYYWVTHGTLKLAQADIQGHRTARLQSPLFLLLGFIAAVAFFTALYARQPPIYTEPLRQIGGN